MFASSLLSSLLIAATFTTNVSADRINIRLEEPIPAWTEAVMKIYSSHPILNIEWFREKDEIKCVTDEQGAICYISAINDIQGNFLSIGYDRNAVKEPVMFDFSSSDPEVKISPAILSMDSEGVFPNENNRTYQGEESLTLYPVSVTLEELQKLIDNKNNQEKKVENTEKEDFPVIDGNKELTRDIQNQNEEVQEWKDLETKGFTNFHMAIWIWVIILIFLIAFPMVRWFFSKK